MLQLNGLGITDKKCFVNLLICYPPPVLVERSMCTWILSAHKPYSCTLISLNWRGGGQIGFPRTDPAYL